MSKSNRGKKQDKKVNAPPPKDTDVEVEASEPAKATEPEAKEEPLPPNPPSSPFPFMAMPSKPSPNAYQHSPYTPHTPHQQTLNQWVTSQRGTASYHNSFVRKKGYCACIQHPYDSYSPI